MIRDLTCDLGWDMFKKEVNESNGDRPLGPRGERGDFEAHDHAMSIPMDRVVQELVDILGAGTVAAIGNVSETRAVAQWMAGREPQRPHVLRFTLQLAQMVANAADPNVARAWFQGSNPHLGDRVPAIMLRTEPLAEIQPALMAAARSFAAR